jgi:hypothetical protein
VLDIDSKEPVAGIEVFAYHTNSKGDYEADDKGVARLPEILGHRRVEDY